MRGKNNGLVRLFEFVCGSMWNRDKVMKFMCWSKWKYYVLQWNKIYM